MSGRSWAAWYLYAYVQCLRTPANYILMAVLPLSGYFRQHSLQAKQ